MRFNPNEWMEVNPGDWHVSSIGEVIVHATDEVAVLIRQNGVEAVLGAGFKVHGRIQGEFEFAVVGPKDFRAFVKAPWHEVYTAKGEVYTNPDRLAHESGSVDAVKQALRMFKLEQREMLRQMREQMRVQKTKVKKHDAESESESAGDETVSSEPKKSHASKGDDKSPGGEVAGNDQDEASAASGENFS